ncbi:MAG: hypothetical protein Q4D39_07035, partial [Coriobacteriaceae bacterium]|nr:hypothetical protein [Coriobacteriaceae bacterium]
MLEMVVEQPSGGRSLSAEGMIWAPEWRHAQDSELKVEIAGIRKKMGPFPHRRKMTPQHAQVKGPKSATLHFRIRVFFLKLEISAGNEKETVRLSGE